MIFFKYNILHTPFNFDSGPLDDLGFQLSDNKTKQKFIKSPSGGLRQYSKYIKRYLFCLLVLRKRNQMRKNCGYRMKTQFGLQFRKVSKKETCK